MATIKLTFRASLSKDKEGTLYYQVIHKQVARQICTGYKIFPSEWNKDDSRIIFQPSIDDKRHTYLMSIAIRIKKDMTSLESIAKKLKQTGKSYCTDDIVSQFAVSSIENGFISFCYNESKSFSLNAHNGLELVKNNLKPDADAELYSFADIYSAIEGNDGNIANAANTEAVNRLNEIFTKGRIIYVMAEGLATSQDNYIGEDSENVGLERNKTLAYNRAYTVVNWLKGNEKFRNVSNNVFAVNALVNPIVKVDDKSVQGLNSKLGRCVKVRIHFVIDK